MNSKLLEMRHRLGDVRRELWPRYKELRLHRLGDQDAWWRERAHEGYLKYERKYADLIEGGVCPLRSGCDPIECGCFGYRG